MRRAGSAGKAFGWSSDQYCGAVGKQANCQVSVGSRRQVMRDCRARGRSVVFAGEMGGGWGAAAGRGSAPEVRFQAKPAIAVDLIKQVLADGVSPAPVLGDEVLWGGQ